jgi:hypothetical protein
MIEGIREAAAIVLEEFGKRGVEVRQARWINEYLNMVYTTTGVFTEDKFFYLKWEKACWGQAGAESQYFKGAGVAVNKDIY